MCFGAKPESKSAWHRLARCSLEADCLEDAEALLSRRPQSVQDNPDVDKLRARCAIKPKDWQRAYQRFVAGRPDAAPFPELLAGGVYEDHVERADIGHVPHKGDVVSTTGGRMKTTLLDGELLNPAGVHIYENIQLPHVGNFGTIGTIRES